MTDRPPYKFIPISCIDGVEGREVEWTGDPPPSPTPLRLRKPDPNPAVVDTALRLLLLARSGEVQGIIYAAALAGGSTRIAEVGSFPSAAERIGAAHMLAHKVTSGVMDHDAEDDPQPPEPDEE